MATARPVRAMDPYAEQFWTFTLSRELRLQQCSACGKFRWPPGPTCDRCLSDDFAWSPLSNTSGTLNPSNSAGRVYCGYSSRPSAKLSSAPEAAAPMTPGNRRTQASISTMAATSPPEST